MAVLVAVLLLVALVLTLAGVVIYLKAWRRMRWRSSTPKTAVGLSNPLFQEGHHSTAKGGALAPTAGPLEPVPTTHPSQCPRPGGSVVTTERPPPAPPASMSRPPSIPVYTQQTPSQVVRRPTSTPPVPPVKSGAAGAKPGPTQGVGPKVALKPPVQRS